jgi:hypothetical protein
LLTPLLQAISHIFEISEDDHPLKMGDFEKKFLQGYSEQKKYLQ